MSSIVIYLIVIGSLLLVGYGLFCLLRSSRRTMLKSGPLAGLAMAMMVLVSIFRENRQEDKKISRLNDKKKT